ncbi:MAG: glyceraldehyde-3-phosphate dehydrogenase [Gammaproteobacteria bacterium]|nr:glyceraldehyde-3-phosphate dehydrogenase [Gammaproteobacteria bacterium]
MTKDVSGDYFSDWKEQEQQAEAMIPVIGRLYREFGVVTTLYGDSIVNASTLDILQAHRQVAQIEQRELSTRDTLPIIEAISRLDLAAARIDLGKLAVNYQNLSQTETVDDYVTAELAEINTGRKPILSEPRDVVLYGFGRIGRLLTRILIQKTGGGDKLRLRAVVVRKGGPDDLIKRTSLLQRDSVHGPLDGTVTIDTEENAIIANGNMIRVIYSDSPSEMDYTLYGIKDALVIDNTGRWSDREGLSQHLGARGVWKVLLTAPGKGNVPNIVYGINHDTLDPQEKILSAASCTTNAIVPPLKVIDDRFGIESGHVETCHAYTNDQNLIDNFHKANRRGRAAPLNMVITSTGAAKAVAKALPQLAGKLTGNAIRVPTPNVSLAILNLNLKTATTVDELNAYFKEIALHSALQQQIDYTNSPEVVSSDFIGSRHTGVVDSLASIVEGNRCVLYVWYDNEYGYSCQVIRLVQHLAGLQLPLYPKEN